MKFSTPLLLCWLLSIAWIDARYRRIPNVLSLGACVVALGILISSKHSLLGASWPSVLMGLGAAIALTIPGYVTGKLGAGDVKLLMAIALLSDLTAVLGTFVIGAFVGLGVAASIPLMHAVRQSLAVYLNRPGWMSVKNPASGGRHIPYGIGLALGFALMILYAPPSKRVALGL